VLSRYVGSYLLDQTVEIKMQLDGSRLFAISEGTPRYELKPTSEKEFYLPDLDADVAFEVDANERVVGFSAKLPMGTITAELAPSLASSSRWSLTSGSSQGTCGAPDREQ